MPQEVDAENLVEKSGNRPAYGGHSPQRKPFELEGENREENHAGPEHRCAANDKGHDGSDNVDSRTAVPGQKAAVGDSQGEGDDQRGEGENQGVQKPGTDHLNHRPAVGEGGSQIGGEQIPEINHVLLSDGFIQTVQLHHQGLGLGVEPRIDEHAHRIPGNDSEHEKNDGYQEEQGNRDDSQSMGDVLQQSHAFSPENHPGRTAVGSKLSG